MRNGRLRDNGLSAKVTVQYSIEARPDVNVSRIQ